jgi:signal transduction histidine kinase
VSELELPDLFTTAARASINERCAAAFLHDVRGTMQALFSAFELLGRSARMGADSVRVEKACDLARRAISQHEKSTLDVLRMLTLQHSAASEVNLGDLVHEVTHFLRNDASNKQVTITVASAPGLNVCAERAKLQTLLMGLLTAAIEEIPSGTELPIAVRRDGPDAVMVLGSHSGFADTRNLDQLLAHPIGPLRSRELTLLFARRFLADQGGRLEIDATAASNGELRLYYPGI